MDTHTTANWRKYILWFVFTILGVLTIWSILSSSNILGSIIGYAIVWTLIVLAYRMWHPVREWLSSDKSLKEWRSERRASAPQVVRGRVGQPQRRLSVLDRENSMDSVGWTGMTQQQEDEWAAIVASNPELRKKRR